MEFDFDAWAKLAKDNPTEFERRRGEMLQQSIDKAPPAFRQRLQGLQSRLDLERTRTATPLASCVRINSLMWAGFFRLRKELAKGSGTPCPSNEPKRSAQVIPFRSGRRPRGDSVRHTRADS